MVVALNDEIRASIREDIRASLRESFSALRVEIAGNQGDGGDIKIAALGVRAGV